MAQKINTKRGDTEVTIRLNADLTGSTVKVLTTVSGVPTILPSTVPTPSTGEVVFQTSTLLAGTYPLEVEVTTALGKIATFPSKGYVVLVVGDDLG